MNQHHYKNPTEFSTRKVSLDRAVKVLGQNGIRVTKENAEIILDFLYLIAKTYKQKDSDTQQIVEP